MASYMPSFMSKNLSTGAEAAYGQPFAFTTGPKFGNNTPKTQQQRRQAKQKTKQARRATANENKQNNPRPSPKPRKKQHNTETLDKTDIVQIAVAAAVGAMEKINTNHLTTSAHSSKKKDMRLKLDQKNLLAFRTAKKHYLEQLVDITSDMGVRAATYAEYQEQKATEFQAMMTTKIETLEKQARVSYKTYDNDKPSKAAEKMQKKIAHLKKDNDKLHKSKKELDDEDDYAEFKKIMHAYYEAELDAFDMTGKAKKDKLKEATKTKSSALKAWAKVHKTDEPEPDETEPDTRSQPEAISDALAEHWERTNPLRK